MLRTLISALTRYPRTMLALYIIFFGLLAFAATDLQIDPSFSSLISDDSQYNTNARALEAAFGQNNGVLIFFSVTEDARLSQRPALLTQTSLENDSEQLADLLRESQYVTSVGPLEFSDDGRYARMSVGIFEPNNPEGIVRVKEDLEFLVSQARLPTGVEASVTGLPVVLDRISTLLITDNLKTVLITAALVFGVLLWYFRNVRVAVIGVAAPLLSLVALVAALVYLDIQITLTLAAVGVIVVGLGADYSIHVLTTYLRHLKEGMVPRKALLLTFDELDIALIAAFLTTLAGFSALILGVSPSSIAQGIALGLAITVIFAVTLLVLPVLLVIFLRSAPENMKDGLVWLENFFDRLAHYQTHHPWRVLLLILALTLVMGVGASQVFFSTSNSNWIPDDDPIALSFRELEYTFGQSDSLTLVITSTRGDLREVSTVRDIQRLEAQLQGLRDVTAIQSPFSDMPLDAARIHELSVQRSQQFNKDFTLSTIRLQSEGFAPDEAGNSLVLQEVEPIIENTPVHNARVGLFGDVVRFQELGESLQRDTAVTTGIGLVLVFVVSTLLYMSFAVGIISLIPIIIAVLWAVGLMGFFGVPFTSLSSGIVSLVLGIGVDFSIHLVNSIRHSRKSKDMEAAIAKALHTTGGAIFLSSLTTFFGFLALTFAQLLGTQRLGWSLAFSIFSVFCVTILFVPVIISLRARILGKQT